MKIQCGACESAEAKVLCCADEAALCAACDEEVHAANKLAGKHQRVPLVSVGSGRVPSCDICLESSGYFFCLEDRALLCRNCDLAIHNANSYVSAHRRFLLTGLQIGPDPDKSAASFSKDTSYPRGAAVESTSNKTSLNIAPSMASPSENHDVLYSQVSSDGCVTDGNVSYSVSPVVASAANWPLDDFFEFTDYNHSYGFTDHGSSKADSGKHGSSGGSLPCRPSNVEMDFDDCSGKVPDISCTAPETPIPHPASGILQWPRTLNPGMLEGAPFVPDISFSRGAPSRSSAAAAAAAPRVRRRSCAYSWSPLH